MQGRPPPPHAAEHHDHWAFDGIVEGTQGGGTGADSVTVTDLQGVLRRPLVGRFPKLA